MIEKKEVIAIAKKTGVHPEAVEREWANGIFIDAFSKQLDTKDFAINGGTCRNKAYNGLPQTYSKDEINSYFEQNRFSMDIDTFISPGLNDKYHVATILTECAVGIENDFLFRLDVDNAKFADSNIAVNHRLEYPRVDVYIPYYGPMYSAKHPAPKIKLTLDSNEPPVLNATRTVLYHPFSDNRLRALVASCLSYPELFGNKLFTFYKRKWGKDLYDVSILMEKYDIMSHLPEIQRVIDTKKSKWHIDPVPEQLDEAFQDAIRKNWNASIPKIVARPPEFGKCMDNLGIIHRALKDMNARLVMEKQAEFQF